MSDLLTELPFGLPGRIFRSPMPYSVFDTEKQAMDLYRQSGVDVVVMLVSDEEAYTKSGRDLRSEYQKNGVEVISMPIPDFSIPTAEQLQKGLATAYAHALAGHNLAVHCNAGIGRTGLFMACLARKVFGIPGEQAAAWVRQYIEHAIENEEQLKMVIGLELEG